MEGPDLRNCPRTLFLCPVELTAGKKTIRLRRGWGNLSPYGLFVEAEALPVGGAVHVKMAAAPPMEAEGIVRSCDREGIHIEFVQVTEANRRRLNDLIAELAAREPLPSSGQIKASRKM